MQLLFCRIPAPVIEKTGGWRQHGAMAAAYITSADPLGCILFGGFTGKTGFHPTQAQLKPPPELVCAILGTVLQRKNPVTGEVEDLDVVQAIAACQEHQAATKSKELPASSFFEVLFFLGTVLVQVCSPFLCYAHAVGNDKFMPITGRQFGCTRNPNCCSFADPANHQAVLACLLDLSQASLLPAGP